MSKVTRREWYERVNAAWPATLPALTADEAIRAARRLYRFVRRRTFDGQVKTTSGNRYSYIRNGVLYVNPDRGWHDLVHDLSHYFHARLSDAKPHASDHARLELRMAKEVVRRGWLDGTLKTPARAPRAKPSADDVRRQKYARILARAKAWESKRKRAETALKKLRRQAAYYERTLSTTAEGAANATA
jgi:hypothetical protein